MANENLLVIIPTYNERENIQLLIPLLLQIDSHPDILVVDDNSPDRTARIVLELKGKYVDRIHIIRREKKLGLGTAYIAGFKFGLERKYAYILTMDADLSHNPGCIRFMMDKIGDADIVIGSRYVKGGGTKNWGILRKINSRTANFLAKKLLGFSCNDCTAGFRLYRKKVIESIEFDKILSNGYSFLVEMLFKCREKGFSTEEVPIIFENRSRGASKISRSEIFKAVMTLFKCWLVKKKS